MKTITVEYSVRASVNKPDEEIVINEGDDDEDFSPVVNDLFSIFEKSVKDAVLAAGFEDVDLSFEEVYIDPPTNPSPREVEKQELVKQLVEDARNKEALEAIRQQMLQAECDHDFEDRSVAGPEYGDINIVCKKCGWTEKTILY